MKPARYRPIIIDEDEVCSMTARKMNLTEALEWISEFEPVMGYHILALDESPEAVYWRDAGRP